MTKLRGLYGITPDGAIAGGTGDDLLCRIDAALAGGLRLLQFRDKSTDAPARRQLADALLRRCRQAGAQLLINDDLPLALAIGADGVHLGGDDGDLAAARAALGANKLLGASCYADLERARAAAPYADYLAFGAVYASPTKPHAKAAPLSLFAAARIFDRPLCAIGGITLANAAPLLSAGADLLAVVSDLFATLDTPAPPDIAARAASFQALFDHGSDHDQKSATV